MNQPADAFTRFQPHRGAVVDAWFAALAGTSFVPRPVAEVRLRLDELVGQALDALLRDSQADVGRRIGADLVALHFVSPRALEGSLRVLGHELLAHLTLDEFGELQPRLIVLLAGIASGYYAAGRDMILREQEEVRAALFVTRQQAEAAEEARAVAEASARARSDLLGRVAHDLRSPLTGIKGQADLLAQRLDHGELNVEWLRARVARIQGSADRMQVMVGELLDAARLQVGEHLDLDLREFDLTQLASRVIERLEFGSNRVRLQSAPAAMVRADRARLERVLENLLSNALKYSPDDSLVEVSVQPLTDGARIIVQDYGVGIPADEVPRVTLPFYRASTAQAVPGIGLGLAGAKAIVDQHGGLLQIESALGRGTRVIVTVPTA